MEALNMEVIGDISCGEVCLDAPVCSEEVAQDLPMDLGQTVDQ